MGNSSPMRSGTTHGEDGANGVARRVVRLLVLLGVAAAAYFALTLLDHPAWADSGSADHLGIASVKAVATESTKVIPKPKSIIHKVIATKNHPPRIHQPTTKSIPVRISKTRQQATQKVRATVSTARTAVSEARAVVRPKLHTPAPLPSPPAVPTLPRPQLPDPPSDEIPAPIPAPTPTPATASPGAMMPHLAPAPARIFALPPTPALVPAPGYSGVTKPPAAPAGPRAAGPPGHSPPANPPRPADRETPTGQARDPGGGNNPDLSTASSSWRPEVAAAGHRLATDITARGRTVRYAGPPS